MFSNRRFTTPGVQSTIPFPIQAKLWDMIDGLRELLALDYLQIFTLHDNIIIHSQEHPAYRATTISPLPVSDSLKICVIDNGSYSTMLLPEEY